MAVLRLLLALALAAPVPVDRVLAVVNGTPVLASDRDTAAAAALVPREEGESDAGYAAATVDALVTLELRWQDLAAAGIDQRVRVDVDAAWDRAADRVGGDAELRRRLAAVGVPPALLRDLLRRAAVVEAYVRQRFSPFTRPTLAEVEAVYRDELVPALRERGEAVPLLDAVRTQIEALVRERKLNAEIERWTGDLESRGVVERYYSR